MDLLSVIHRWRFRQGMPIREIVRPSKLDPFAEMLSGWLRIEVGKSLKQKRTAKKMHADFMVLGYDGFYERVAAFVRAWKAKRQREQQTSGRGTFVPLVFAAGESFQFDWNEDWAIISGRQTKLQLAHGQRQKMCSGRSDL